MNIKKKLIYNTEFIQYYLILNIYSVNSIFIQYLFSKFDAEIIRGIFRSLNFSASVLFLSWYGNNYTIVEHS